MDSELVITISDHRSDKVKQERSWLKNGRFNIPFLFEGSVISELIKWGMPPAAIKFWRTKAGHEVDLLLEHGGGIKPVEIKYKKRLKQSDFRGLERFHKAYPESGPGYMVNLGSNRSKKNGPHILSPFEIHTLIEQAQDSGPLLNY